MSDLIAIAQSTFGRASRMKAPYFILIGCVLIVGAMGLYGVLSAGRAKEMMFDAALCLSLIVGMLTAMSSVFEIPRELKEQTAQLILTKPLGRTHFIVGKFLGVSMLCVYNVAIVCIGSALAIYMKYNSVDPNLYIGCALIAAEAVLLTAVGVMLSLLLRDAVAAVVLFLLFVIGHALQVLPVAFGSVFAVVGYILPNLCHTDFSVLLGNGVAVPREVFLWAICYTVTYSIAVLGIAVAVFQRRDVA